MRREVLIGLLLCGAVALAACSGPRLKVGETFEGEVIDAEGLVPYLSDDLPGTKAAGLAKAQRSAVERVVGVFLAGRTVVDKAVAIESRILAKTQGYIKKYDILSEKREGNFWRTKIRAYVAFGELGMDLEELGLMAPKDIGNPRIAVLIDETIDGEPSDTTHAGDGMTAVMVENGYTVVERSVQAGAAMQKMIEAVERGDTKAVRDLGAQLNVEVVVLGEGEANKLDPHPRFKGFSSYRARINAKAIKSGTGQILSVVSRQASGMDVDAGMASAKALKSVAEIVAEEMLPKMTEVLRRRTEISLKASAIKDMDHLQALQKAVKGISGVDEIFLRHYSKGSAEISVLAGKLGGAEIAAKLAKIRKPALRVQSSSASEVSIELLP